MHIACMQRLQMLYINNTRKCALRRCPPKYVINAWRGEQGNTGCDKCGGELVSSPDKTQCGCSGKNMRQHPNDRQVCTRCEEGTFWPGGIINPGNTCRDACGDDIPSDAGSSCGRLKRGWYFRARDATTQLCRPGHFCPGWQGAIGSLTGDQKQGLIDRTLQRDQGIYACPAGTTTRETAEHADYEVGHCDRLLPGWMYCPSGASVPTGYTAFKCGSGRTFTAATQFDVVIPCPKGGLCPGADYLPDTPAVPWPDVTHKGFTACDNAPLGGNKFLAPGFWSAAGATSVADCSLLSPTYYWSGTAPVLCPANSFCPGGTPITNTTVPFGIYACPGAKACTAPGGMGCDCEYSAWPTAINDDGGTCKAKCAQ